MATLRVVVLTTLACCALQICHSTFTLHLSAAPAVNPADDSSFTLEGKITAKEGSKLTVNTGENIIFHVVYNDKTVIKNKDGSPATGKDLRAGVRIAVAGDLAESGEITAKTIDIQGEGSGKP